MSKLVCACVDDIFKNYDYNNLPIKNNLLKQHITKENAWITIDKEVYSIRKDDIYLLDIFKDYYGKNVKEFIMKNNIFKNYKEKVLLLDKLKDRKIGYLIE
jgi:hypothetical protein